MVRERGLADGEGLVVRRRRKNENEIRNRFVCLLMHSHASGTCHPPPLPDSSPAVCVVFFQAFCDASVRCGGAIFVEERLYNFEILFWV